VALYNAKKRGKMRENGLNWQRQHSWETQNNLGEQRENAKKHMK
jgi:hypothetical protein